MKKRFIFSTERSALTVRRLRRNFGRNWELYIFLMPAVIILFLFNYVPMYGLQIAFKDFDIFAGITDSPWVGLDHFIRFFSSSMFWTLLRNTLGLSLYWLVVNTIIPIILALLISQVEHAGFKRFVQNVVYVPYMISAVVVVGILTIFLDPTSGLVNVLLRHLGNDAVNFMAEPDWFRHLYVWSGVWQSAGWGTIIYLSALSNVSPELYEAAKMDGANKLQRVIHIDLPAILPTIIIILILNTGSIMNIGFEKVYLMQSPLNLGVSEIISTYVYKIGLLNSDFSYSAAVGMFNSVVNCILLLLVNTFARKTGESSLW